MKYFVGINNNLYISLSVPYMFSDRNALGKYYLLWWKACAKRVLDNGEYFILKILRIQDKSNQLCISFSPSLHLQTI